MKHRKNEGEEYIQAFPHLKKWINECCGWTRLPMPWNS